MDDGTHDQESTPPGSLAEEFDLRKVLRGLLKDLEDLRAGRISVPRARASAELGKVVIRGMRLVLDAQRMAFEQAKALPPDATDHPPSPGSRRKHRAGALLGARRDG